MDFATKYRRLLHAEFDELLDADEKIYTGPIQAMNSQALADRVSTKWAFDEKIRANSKSKYGKDEVMRSLQTSIALYRKMIEGISPIEADAESRSRSYTRIISDLETFILKLESLNT